MEDRGDHGGPADEPATGGAARSPAGALASELRTSTTAADARADAEEAERLALQASLRRRDLADVSRELMARGDRVALDVAGRRLVGVVVHATGDLVSIVDEGGRVDASLRHLRRLAVVEPDATPGRDVTSGSGPGTFKARLFELELSRDLVELALAGGGEVTGRLRAVGVDHVLVRDLDAREWVIALDELAYVATRSARMV